MILIERLLLGKGRGLLGGRVALAAERIPRSKRIHLWIGAADSWKLAGNSRWLLRKCARIVLSNSQRLWVQLPDRQRVLNIQTAWLRLSAEAGDDDGWIGCSWRQALVLEILVWEVLVLKVLVGEILVGEARVWETVVWKRGLLLRVELVILAVERSVELPVVLRAEGVPGLLPRLKSCLKTRLKSRLLSRLLACGGS